MFVIAFKPVMYGCAALRAKAKDGRAAFVSNSRILVRFALDGDSATIKSRLSAEDTASSALTCQTMAYGHTNRLHPHGELELAATAGGGSGIHRSNCRAEFFWR